MARATTAQQRALVAACNNRNSTAGAAGAAAPRADLHRPPPIANIETIDNLTLVDDLNRRLLQDQIDQNAAIAA
jgi:hypothetical protein